MNDVIVTRHKYHIVRSLPGCTVRQEGANGTVIETTVPADEDTPVFAHSGRWSIEGDENVTVTEVFKLAPQQRLALLGVLGGPADVLPAGYKRLEYLEGTGTQCCKIPTEVGSEAFRAETDILFTAAGNLQVMGFSTYARYYWGINESRRYTLGSSSVIPNASPNVRRIVVYENKNDESRLEAGGRSVSRLSADALQARTEYGIWHPAVIHTAVDYCVAKIFSLKIFKSSRLLTELLPCLDATGAPCMYDLVSRQPFYNIGTGDFLYPTESTTYSLRRVLPDWGKLTEHGLRRLYHAPANYKGELFDYALENGYKPIVEPEQPEEGYWSPQWRETEEEIVLDWVETEPPMEEFLTNN